MNNKKLDDLYPLLEHAEQLSQEFSGGYSGNFLSTEEFHKVLSESIANLKLGNLNEIKRLYIWFAPTSAWDDFIGKDGEDLANEIFPLVSELKSRYD